MSVIGYFPIPGGCQIGCPPASPVPPNITFFPTFPLYNDAIAGFFIWVEKGRERDVHTSLRVQDLSRQAETWGTELPVVPEDAFLTKNAVLEDVPLSSDFCSNLRVYDLEPFASHSVRVRLFSIDPGVRVPALSDGSRAPTDQLLLDRVLPFSAPDVFTKPAMIYLDLSSLPELSGADRRLRIEVTPADETPIRFWALASTTNNTTQHVTTISPR